MPRHLTLVCQGYLGVTRAYQGHADAALRLTGQAAGCARRTGDPFGLLYVLFCDAWAATVAQAPTRVLDSATEQAALIGRHGFRQWGIGPQFFRGWAEARSGDPRRGEQQIQAALAEMDASGTPGFRPLVLGLLAEAQLLARHPAEGRRHAAPGHPGGRPAGRARVRPATTRPASQAPVTGSPGREHELAKPRQAMGLGLRPGWRA